MPSDYKGNAKGAARGDYTGEYMAPDHKASTVRGSYMSDDSPGVEDGLSMRHDMDSNYLHNVMYNNTPNPVSGNVRQVPKPYETKSVTEKGHKMGIC